MFLTKLALEKAQVLKLIYNFNSTDIRSMSCGGDAGGPLLLEAQLWMGKNMYHIILRKITKQQSLVTI